MHYYIGVDNGGTFVKAVLFNQNGMAVSQSKEPIELLTPHPGFTERDMEQLWRLNAKVIRDAIAASGVAPAQIRGVSFSGHGKGLYLWGDGKPAYPGILSTDTRAVEYADRINQSEWFPRLFEKTVQRALCCQPIALLQWFMDNDPEVIRQTKWIFGVKDYIRFRLTGLACAEITDFSGSNLVNLKTAAYDDEILRLLGLEGIKGKLPPLMGSTDVCGAVTTEAAALTGLAEGTPCAAGMFDIDACAIAMNVVNEDYLAVIAGTWSINEYISRSPVDDHSVKMNSLYGIPGYYLVEESSPTSASNLEWFIRQLMDETRKRCEAEGSSVYTLVNQLVESVEPQDCDVYFLPYIFGSNDNGNAKACFVGLSSYHTRAHMLRAIYEGVVFCHMVHIERLLRHRSDFKAIRLAGGVTNSRVWSQMFADVTGYPVEIIETQELGAFGAAICASVACGDQPGVKAATEKLVKVAEVYHPNARMTELYREKYCKYCRISSLMEALW